MPLQRIETPVDPRKDDGNQEHGCASDGGEEQALVMAEQTADQPSCLGQATGVGRNNRAGRLIGTFNWHVVGPIHV